MMGRLFVALQRISRAKKVYRALILATCILAGLPVAKADNVDGAWSDLEDWPLIGLHAVLTPDGRVIAQAGSNVWFSLDGITFRAV